MTAGGARPRASVIIPTYRRTPPLRDLLESLARETLAGDFEVILADDGSGEEVAAVAAAYEPRFRSLRFTTGPNAGPGVARNRGVAAASADVLLFVDSDCLVEPGWVRALTEAVEAGAELAFGPTRSAVPSLEPFVHSIVSEDELITFTNVGVSRRLFGALGGFRPEVSRIAEDRDFFARAHAVGVTPTRVAAAVITHPPRPRDIRFAALWTRPPAVVDLGVYYASWPELHPEVVAANRRLLAKGAIKLAVATLPFGLPGLVAHALVTRRRVNGRLAAAGVPFRIPVSAALKYGLLQPVNDLSNFARRARAGFGWLRTR